MEIYLEKGPNPKFNEQWVQVNSNFGAEASIYLYKDPAKGEWIKEWIKLALMQPIQIRVLRAAGCF